MFYSSKDMSFKCRKKEMCVHRYQNLFKFVDLCKIAYSCRVKLSVPCTPRRNVNGTRLGARGRTVLSHTIAVIRFTFTLFSLVFRDLFSKHKLDFTGANIYIIFYYQFEIHLNNFDTCDHNH